MCGSNCAVEIAVSIINHHYGYAISFNLVFKSQTGLAGCIQHFGFIQGSNQYGYIACYTIFSIWIYSNVDYLIFSNIYIVYIYYNGRNGFVDFE